MGQSSPTIDQLRLHLLALPQDRLVSRADIKHFCGTTDCSAYRAFLKWVRDAGISKEPSGKGRKQPVAAWPAGQLIKAAETKKTVDPNKVTREYHEMISDIWLTKGVKLIVKELPKALITLMKANPKGFVLSSVLGVGLIALLVLAVVYSLGRHASPELMAGEPPSETQAVVVPPDPPPSLIDVIHSIQQSLDDGNYETAITRLNDIIDESSNQDVIGYANYVLGAAYDRAGDIESAKAALNTALAIYTNTDKAKGVFKTEVRLARIATFEEDKAETDRHLDRAFALYSFVDASQKAFYHVARAESEQMKGDLDKGIDHAMKAYQLYGKNYPSRAFDALTFAAMFFIRKYECGGNEDDLIQADSILDKQEITASRYETTYPRGYYHYRLAKVYYWKVKAATVPRLARGDGLSSDDIEKYIESSGDIHLVKEQMDIENPWPDCR